LHSISDLIPTTEGENFINMAIIAIEKSCSVVQKFRTEEGVMVALNLLQICTTVQERTGTCWTELCGQSVNELTTQLNEYIDQVPMMGKIRIALQPAHEPYDAISKIIAVFGPTAMRCGDDLFVTEGGSNFIVAIGFVCHTM
jgi:hypothetical protein